MNRLISGIGAAAVLGSAALAAAQSIEPSYEELARTVDQLRERLDQYEQKQADRHATLAAIRQDATARSVVNAGYDRGFFIRNDDGSFSLRPRVQAHFRGVASYNEGSDDTESGFEIRRLRPRVDGNVFSKDFTYSFVLDVNRQGGAVTLLDAWAQYKFSDAWALRVGQFKESVFRERDISSFAAQAVDRSLADTLLGGSITDRVQGLSLIYGGAKDNPLRGSVTLHDGANSRNTNFVDSGLNFGVGGRLEYLVFGQWSELNSFSAKGAKEASLSVGGGFDFTQRGSADTLLTTLDVIWKDTNGWSAFVALHGNVTTQDDDDDLFDYGGVAQVGYLLNPHWEVFGRYSLAVIDTGADRDNYHEITAGVNYFLGPDGEWGHNAKVTLDAVYLPEGVPAAQTALGYTGGEDSQFVVRLQLTLQI